MRNDLDLGNMIKPTPSHLCLSWKWSAKDLKSEEQSEFQSVSQSASQSVEKNGGWIQDPCHNEVNRNVNTKFKTQL